MTTRLWSIRDIADALGVSRQAIAAELAAGRFPDPDFIVGRGTRTGAARGWRDTTVRRWAAAKGRTLNP